MECWVEEDEVWNHTWDNHYIASFGVNMPEDDRIGRIKPGIFLGLFAHYYVELRLPKIEKQSSQQSITSHIQ